MYHNSVTLKIAVMVFSWDWECAVKVQAERLSCPVCWLELGMRMMPLLHADLPPTPRSIIPASVARHTSFMSFSSPKHFRYLPPSIYQLDFYFYPFIFFLQWHLKCLDGLLHFNVVPKHYDWHGTGFLFSSKYM